MAIPGYDPADLEEHVTRTDESTEARVDVVAGVVPDAFDVLPSDADPPDDAVSKPVELINVDGLTAVDSLRLALPYEPSALSDEATPEDVTIVVEREGEWRPLPSTVQRESRSVSAELSEAPGGSTFVAVVGER